MSNQFSEKKIGNFSIGKTIGKGTFGKVREGIHIPTGQKVAIKILQKKKIKNAKDIQRIQKELEILKSLNHPNILKLLQVKQTQKQIFIVTQLARGQQLYERIVKKGVLPIEQACKYFIQLYQAIKYLHSRNVSHRDVKPQNIIVDGQNLKLIDFGLSTQWTQSKVMMETPCGSPCYAAPQMVLGRKYDCRKVDVWALGITLYAMLAGKLPFQHQNTQKLYRMIQNSEFEDIKGVPSYVNILIRAMVQKDPKKRININEIGQNIWIKDSIIRIQKDESNKSEWNEKTLKQIQKLYGIPLKNLVVQIVNNSLSDISTFYYLKCLRIKNQMCSGYEQEFHDGPFHIQFVFKNFVLLQNFLQKNEIKYQWMKDKTNAVREQSNEMEDMQIKRYIKISGQILSIKRLKNLPKLIYLPLKRQWLKNQANNNNNHIISQQSRQKKSYTNLNSNRSNINNYCIQTF